MEIEWLILGDYAHMADGKLYLQGGGWERLNVNSGFPTKQMFGIATSVLVPWDETNQLINLEIEVQTEDGVMRSGQRGAAGSPWGWLLGDRLLKRS